MFTSATRAAREIPWRPIMTVGVIGVGVGVGLGIGKLASDSARKETCSLQANEIGKTGTERTFIIEVVNAIDCKPGIKTAPYFQIKKQCSESEICVFEGDGENLSVEKQKEIGGRIFSFNLNSGKLTMGGWPKMPNMPEITIEPADNIYYSMYGSIMVQLAADAIGEENFLQSSYVSTANKQALDNYNNLVCQLRDEYFKACMGKKQ